MGIIFFEMFIMAIVIGEKKWFNIIKIIKERRTLLSKFNIDVNEFTRAIHSLHAFLLTYSGARKSHAEVFKEWLKTTNFIFRDKETMKVVFEATESLSQCPIDSLIVTAEAEIIPDFREFLKYDTPPLI